MWCSKETCTPIKQVWEWSVGELLYTTTYLIYQAKEKEKALRKIKRS